MVEHVPKTLHELLVDADAGAGRAFAPPPGFAGQVRRAARRQVLRRAGIGAAAVAAGLVAAALLTADFATDHKPRLAAGRPSADPAVLLARAAKLEAEARSASLIVEAMRACEQDQARQAVLRRAEATATPLEKVDRLTDEAALAVMQSAEQAYWELNLPDQAEASYELVIHCYPDTRWAELARKRLAGIRGRERGRPERKDTHHEQPLSCGHLVLRDNLGGRGA